MNGAAPVEDKTSPTVLEGQSPDGADLESLRARLANEQGLRELAEETVTEVERERDEAKALAEAREQARLSLVDRVDELAGRTAELEKELERRPEGGEGPRPDGRDPGGLPRRDGGRPRGGEAAGGRLGEKLTEATAELDGRRAITELRGKYADMLLNCVADAKEPTGWALERLDMLTGIAPAEGSD